MGVLKILVDVKAAIFPVPVNGVKPIFGLL